MSSCLLAAALVDLIPQIKKKKRQVGGAGKAQDECVCQLTGSLRSRWTVEPLLSVTLSGGVTDSLWRLHESNIYVFNLRPPCLEDTPWFMKWY